MDTPNATIPYGNPILWPFLIVFLLSLFRVITLCVRYCFLCRDIRRLKAHIKVLQACVDEAEALEGDH